jgi:hypothetical protein
VASCSPSPAATGGNGPGESTARPPPFDETSCNGVDRPEHSGSDLATTQTESGKLSVRAVAEPSVIAYEDQDDQPVVVRIDNVGDVALIQSGNLMIEGGDGEAGEWERLEDRLFIDRAFGRLEPGGEGRSFKVLLPPPPGEEAPEKLHPGWIAVTLEVERIPAADWPVVLVCVEA